MPPYDASSPPAARRPRYARFVGTGAVLGLLAAMLVAQLGPGSARYSARDVLFYVGLLSVLVGGLVGGAVAVLVERAPRKGGPARR